ncbi:MAG TPA: hypothetical protein VK983_05260 [Candidatus Limnocylindrales bacterium]|nr:hypothetical protein [Candidatus Limnocylindrales bacterium]
MTPENFPLYHERRRLSVTGLRESAAKICEDKYRLLGSGEPVTDVEVNVLQKIDQLREEYWMREEDLVEVLTPSARLLWVDVIPPKALLSVAVITGYVTDGTIDTYKDVQLEGSPTCDTSIGLLLEISGLTTIDGRPHSINATMPVEAIRKMTALAISQD